MPLPLLGWAAIAIGTAAAAAMFGSDDSSSSNSSSYDREYEERQARERERTRKKDNLSNEIRTYKSQAKADCSRRFNAEIDFFNNFEVQVRKIDESKAKKYENENLALVQALKELENFKRA